MPVPCGVPGIQGEKAVEDLVLPAGADTEGRGSVEGRNGKQIKAGRNINFLGAGVWVWEIVCERVCMCARAPVTGETVVLEHPLSRVLSAPRSRNQQLCILPWGGERPSLEPVLNPRGLGPASSGHSPCNCSSTADWM